MTEEIDRLFDGQVFEPELASGFLPAVDGCFRTLCDQFPRYAEFVASRGNVPDAIATLEQLDDLPPMFLPVLKTVRFELPADVHPSIHLTSSGTSGNPSVIPLDEENMQRRVRAMTEAYRQLGAFAQSCSAFCFLLDPSTTQMAGSLVIDAVLRSLPEVEQITYLARMGTSGPEFSLESAVSAVGDAITRGPVVLVGYPALIAAAIQQLRAAGQAKLPLPAGSFILTGGGWKSFLPGVQFDQAEFRQLAGDYFQLPSESIRDMFGMSECPAVFVQSSDGKYRVPNFSLAQAIDPATGRSVPDGEIGLLQLTVPLTTCYPLLKILTTDKVIMQHDGEAAPVLIPQGRTTAARFETCAMKIGQAVA